MDTTSANVSQVDDLFTAHDFDININLPTDAQGKVSFIINLMVKGMEDNILNITILL
jgi:hypothetical protein